MNDRYLKFDDQAQAQAAFEAAGLVVGGKLIIATHSYAVDVIGTIYRPTGAMVAMATPNGTVDMAEMEPVAGWHVNMRMIDGELPAALAAFEIPAPATPKRVWA